MKGPHIPTKREAFRKAGEPDPPLWVFHTRCDYELVTTDCPQVKGKTCTLWLNGGFLRIAVLVPRGRAPGGVLGKITVFTWNASPGDLRNPSSAAPKEEGALQITFNSNRMITIRIIRLMPPPP